MHFTLEQIEGHLPGIICHVFMLFFYIFISVLSLHYTYKRMSYRLINHCIQMAWHLGLIFLPIRTAVTKLYAYRLLGIVHIIYIFIGNELHAMNFGLRRIFFSDHSSKLIGRYMLFSLSLTEKQHCSQ